MSATNHIRTESTDGRTGRNAEIEHTRARALLLFAVEDIQSYESGQLQEMKSLLQHGSKAGVWQTPRHWAPPSKSDTVLAVDLGKRILDAVAPQVREENSREFQQDLGQAVLLLERYLLLVRTGPARIGKRAARRPIDVTTLVGIAYSAGPALLACALTKRHVERATGLDSDCLDEAQPILGAISRHDLLSVSEGLRNDVLIECERMRMLAERKLWLEVPSVIAVSKVEAMNGTALANEKPKERDEHLPFPDKYISEMGTKSLWLMKDLAPNVFACALQMEKVWKESARSGWAEKTISKYRSRRTREILGKHVWKDRTGNIFHAPEHRIVLPVELGFPGRKPAEIADAEEQRWPPKNFRDMKALFGAIQMAHYFVVALSMGARQSETLTLERTCVVEAADGRKYADGRTFKLVQSFDGERREWLLPDLALEAIEQQVRLVSLVEQLSDHSAKGTNETTTGPEPHHLWAQFSAAPQSDLTLPLRDINKYLKRFAKSLALSEEPGGQNIRSHRFRKTLARLVALALTQAPRILMDVFGHKSIEMTLYYILTDKDLRAEVETVTRELRVMRAKEAVERMVEAQLKPNESAPLAGYGGLGAVTLGTAVHIYRERVHRRGEEWNAQSTYELAELLTMQGSAWEQVRTGVLCTKLPGEAGPCNMRKGRPEPSKCQSTCGHRLEESFLREEVEASIADCVGHYERARADGEDLMAAHWAAQVRTHIVRFGDIKVKWLANSTVASLLSHDIGVAS